MTVRMRTEGNPLDLNNVPEDNNNTRDGKQTSWDTSSSTGGYRKKKSGGKEEDDGKVYKCRFCSLKFSKSQALGGHMNSHRQEGETETLNKARRLVFTNGLTPVHLGYPSNAGRPISPHGGICYHHYHNYEAIRQDMENVSKLHPQFRSMYSPTIFSTSSSPTSVSPPPRPYKHRSPHLFTFQAASTPKANKYFACHDLINEYGNNYTCIGTPVTGLGIGNIISGGDVRDVSLCSREDGQNSGTK